MFLKKCDSSVRHADSFLGAELTSIQHFGLEWERATGTRLTPIEWFLLELESQLAMCPMYAFFPNIPHLFTNISYEMLL